jgi:hypothetical protein
MHAAVCGIEVGLAYHNWDGWVGQTKEMDVMEHSSEGLAVLAWFQGGLVRS